MSMMEEGLSENGDIQEGDQDYHDFLKRYKSIQVWHVRSVLVYWVCTIAMLIECFILFIIVVTPAVLKFPEEFEYLRVQEITLFILACL